MCEYIWGPIVELLIGVDASYWGYAFVGWIGTYCHRVPHACSFVLVSLERALWPRLAVSSQLPYTAHRHSLPTRFIRYVLDMLELMSICCMSICAWVCHHISRLQEIDSGKENLKWKACIINKIMNQKTWELHGQVPNIIQNKLVCSKYTVKRKA